MRQSHDFTSGELSYVSSYSPDEVADELGFASIQALADVVPDNGVFADLGAGHSPVGEAVYALGKSRNIKVLKVDLIYPKSTEINRGTNPILVGQDLAELALPDDLKLDVGISTYVFPHMSGDDVLKGVLPYTTNSSVRRALRSIGRNMNPEGKLFVGTKALLGALPEGAARHGNGVEVSQSELANASGKLARYIAPLGSTAFQAALHLPRLRSRG